MKKFIFVMPFMAVSLLANCGGGSTPSEDVKFSIQESSVTLKEDNTVKVHLDWEPSSDIIEFDSFTFTLDSGFTTATVAPGTVGDRPLELTITFASALSTNDKGDLKFHYNDKTIKKEGEGKVNDINIKVKGEKPSFSVTDSTVDYDDGTHSAMVELNWEPESDSITFTNLDFTYGTKHADEVTAEATTSSPTHIQISFGDAGLDKDVTGTLTFAYTDTTTGVTGVDEIKNITIDVDEPTPPVTTYHISMVTEGTDIEDKDLPTDRNYESTINVTATNKILNGLTLVTLKDSNTDITTHCDYDPEQDNKSASLTIPLEYLTNNIEVTVALIDEPEEKGIVRWVNYDNTDLVVPYELPEGSYAEYKGNTPTQPKDGSYVYQFSGWDPDPTVKEIVGGKENVFKAQYDKVATTNLAASMKLVIPSGNDDLTFSFDCTATKKITIDWGDTTVDNNKSHTYSTSGTYNVSIYGEDITTVSAGEKGKDYLSELELKNKITAIPNNAFESCTSLTKIDMPSTVASLGEYAFASCTLLNDFVIPSAITSISAHAFEFCTSLTSVVIKENVTSIGNAAFKDCTSLATVNASFDTLKTIGNSAFYGCTTLTYIYIPNGVTSIGDYAFGHCSSLSSIHIPDTIISVGYRAFYECNLTYTTDNNCRYLSGGSDNQHLLLVESISKDITSVTIHNSCKVVCDRAFNYCNKIATVNIPNSVTSIGNNTFFDCDELSRVTFNDAPSLINIGDAAFAYCAKLTNMTIPNKVSFIGSDAFNICSGLKTVDLTAFTEKDPDKIPSLGERAFNYCHEELVLEVAEGMVGTFQGKAGWSAYADRIQEA